MEVVEAGLWAAKTELSIVLFVVLSALLLLCGLVWAIALLVRKFGGERIERFGRRFWAEFRNSGIALPTWLHASALGTALVGLAYPALELAIPQVGRGYGLIVATAAVTWLIWISWAFVGAWMHVRLQPDDDAPRSPDSLE